MAGCGGVALTGPGQPHDGETHDGRTGAAAAADVRAVAGDRDGAGPGAQLRTGVRCLLAVAGSGLVVGLLWWLLAPRPDVLPVDGGLQYADTESKDFIAGDGTLFLLCLAAGLLTGGLVWRRARGHGVGAVLGMVLGAGLGAWLASRAGVLGDDREAVLAAARAGRLEGPTDLPLQLRARSVLLVWPAFAALAFTVLSVRHPDLTDDAPEGVSSG